MLAPLQNVTVCHILRHEDVMVSRHTQFFGSLVMASTELDVLREYINHMDNSLQESQAALELQDDVSVSPAPGPSAAAEPSPPPAPPPPAPTPPGEAPPPDPSAAETTGDPAPDQV